MTLGLMRILELIPNKEVRFSFDKNFVVVVVFVIDFNFINFFLKKREFLAQ